MTMARMDVPIGTVLDFAGASVPAGYLECDGSAVSRAAYPKLFAAIGTAWGAGNGSTTFNLPNLGGRTCIGKGSRAVGNTGGSETHTLTTSEIPSHAHSVGAHAHGLNSHKHKYDKANTPTEGTAITVNQMPSHKHGFGIGYGAGPAAQGNYLVADNNGAAYALTLYKTGGETSNPLRNTGGGAAHTHALKYTSTDSGAASGSTANSTAFDSGAAGGGAAHSIMQPYAVVRKVIRAA